MTAAPQPRAQNPMARRVLHVVRPAQGGIRQHVLNLLARTDRTRFSLALAAPGDFLATVPGDVQAEAFPLLISSCFSPLKDLTAAARLGSLARHADVVHAHGLRAGWIAALAHLRRPFPLLITAHNLVDPGGWPARLGLRLIGRRASRIVAVSEATAAGLVASGIPTGKILVIPNGVDLAHFTTLPKGPKSRDAPSVPLGEVTVGCIARLSPEKGVDVLLRAATLMPGREFLVAGDGPERDVLAKNAPPNVRLLGRVADTRVLLGASDVLAIPSQREGQGIVALEAMAAGVPIVASRVGGLAEMLTDGDTALLVPPDDAEALAAALGRLLDNADLRHHLTDNAGMLVRHKYGLDQMVEAVVAVYEGLS